MYHYYALSQIAQYRIDDLVEGAATRNMRSAPGRRDLPSRPNRRRRRTR
jgi:hypothetical protein